MICYGYPHSTQHINTKPFYHQVSLYCKEICPLDSFDCNTLSSATYSAIQTVAGVTSQTGTSTDNPFRWKSDVIIAHLFVANLPARRLLVDC